MGPSSLGRCSWALTDDGVPNQISNFGEQAGWGPIEVPTTGSTSGSTTTQGPFLAIHARRSVRTLLIAVATVAVAAAVAGLALAGQGPVPDREGGPERGRSPHRRGRRKRTHAVPPERRNARHVLCTGSCLRTWPPLTVGSRATKLVEGRGVQGRLAIFRRPDGRLQVTLRGFPLYRFASDRVAGQARGNGIHRSGGVWALVLARAPKLPPIPPPAGIPGPKLPPIPPPA